jgi:hypothetical protein
MMDSDDDDIYPTNEASNDTRIKQEDPEEEGEEVEDDSDVRVLRAIAWKATD